MAWRLSLSSSLSPRSIMSAPVKANEEEGYQVEPQATESSIQSRPEPESLTSSVDNDLSSPPLSPPTAHSQLAPLRALFPSTSDDILEAVLEAHGGDLQASTESLIDLNNPEFKTDPAQREEVSSYHCRREVGEA